MKKWNKTLLMAIPMTLAVAFTSLAGQWHNDMNGWWYENDDGSYPTGGWYWLDGNQDGTAECYYFGSDGYMLGEQGSVDGYEVDENGAWIENGKVQEKTVEIAEKTPSQTGEQSLSADASDPMSAYLTAQEKNNSLDSVSMHADYLISMGDAETSLETGMALDFKIKGIQSGSLQFTADGSMNVLGMDMPVSMFYTDGYYYMDMMGMKVKQAMPMDEAMETAMSNAETGVSASMFQDLQMHQENGNTVLTYTLSPEDMTKYMAEATGTDTAYSGYKVDYRMNIASGEAVIDQNGYCISEQVYMDMDMITTDPETGESTALNYKMDMTIQYDDPSQAVEVVIPSTEGYEDMTVQTI